MARVEPGTPFSTRPSGTVTFLFSDIEGSTERWERDRKAMRVALERHDAAVRAALEGRGGNIFKTVGDAFCAAFSTASDAIAAALDTQRALSAENFSNVNGLRVRIALHTGTADERDGDYFGPTVNRVARLLAIAHGGQVLLSAATAELLHGEMPPESSLLDLGEHRLKDLAHAERVWQLIAPELQEAFPALRSLNERPNNLPLQITSFVGRQNEVTEIKSLIASHRLVTLVGIGGVGKTRCAIQVCAELLDGSRGAAWLVELASIADPAFVGAAIAQALNVQEQPNRPLLETLVMYLKRKRLLLILDNCEHVIDEVRRVASAIVHSCPDVRILATSREPLNVTGEATYRMPSLAVPNTPEALLAEGAARYAAVQLFVDRALLSNNRFTLTEENARHVAEICRRLDGIPLAIELAAARVKLLSPKQLAQKLDERFRVLTGGDRSALPRQQTMRALIDWSYDLLSTDERAFFRKLSIFAGGFTLETAIAVCSNAETDEIMVLDLISSLVDKSLVHAEEAQSGTRYRLLESMRQYASEKRTEAGEDQIASAAHAAAFLAVAVQLNRMYETMSDREWLALVALETENFRAALLWAFGAHGDAGLGQQLVGTFFNAWLFLNAAEGRRWVRTAQERIDTATPAEVAAALDLAEAELAANLSQHKAALAAAERALLRSGELPERQRTRAQQFVGRGLIYLGKIREGESLLQRALEKLRTLELHKAASSVLEDLASAALIAGDLVGARHRYGEAVSAARTAGADFNEAVLATHLAEVEFRAGDAAAALLLSREADSLMRAIHSVRGIAVAMGNEAAYFVAERRFDEARASARQALGAARDAQALVTVAFTLQHLAGVSAFQNAAHGLLLDERRRAARILGYVDARLAALEALRQYTEQQEYDAIMTALRGTLNADEASKLMEEGSKWDEDRAVAEAMLV